MPKSKGSALQTLDRRSREIFRQIVDSYLRDRRAGRLAQSARVLPVSLSPASIRNVMADLEQLGLIYAPHTSAGRLPTRRGLRFFVDACSRSATFPTTSAARSRRRSARRLAPHRRALLTEASQVLSGLSRGAGVVLAGKADLPLKHIEFIHLEPTPRWSSWSAKTALSRTA